MSKQEPISLERLLAQHERDRAEIARLDVELAQERAAAKLIDVVFDGPPGHDAGRFVEVEDEHGRSIRVGEWINRGNGLWALRLNGHANLTAEDLDALRWLRDKGNIPTGRSVECDDPQCGDSTWDHYCNAGWEEIPEAKRAIAVLDKLLGKEHGRG